MSKIANIFKKLKKKFHEFVIGEDGGNLIEYALLVGFALFIFFIIVGIVTSLLDWTIEETNSFFEMFENMNQ